MKSSRKPPQPQECTEELLAQFPAIAMGFRFVKSPIPPTLWIVWIDDAWFHGLAEATIDGRNYREKKCVFADIGQDIDARIGKVGGQVTIASKYRGLFGSGRILEFLQEPGNWNWIDNPKSFELPNKDDDDGRILTKVCEMLSEENDVFKFCGLILTNFEGFQEWRHELLGENRDSFVIFDIKHLAARQRGFKLVTTVFSNLPEALRGLLDETVSADVGDVKSPWLRLGLALAVDSMSTIVEAGLQSTIPFRMCMFTSAGLRDDQETSQVAQLWEFIDANNRATPDGPQISLSPRIWDKNGSFGVAKKILEHARLLWRDKLLACKWAFIQSSGAHDDWNVSKEPINAEVLLEQYWSDLRGPEDLRIENLGRRRLAWKALSDSGLLESHVTSFQLVAGIITRDVGESHKSGIFRFPREPWILPAGGESLIDPCDVALRQLERQLAPFAGLFILGVNPSTLDKVEIHLARSIDTVRRIRLRFPELTIVIETGHHGHRAEEAFYRAGANAVYHLSGSSDVRSALDSNQLDADGKRLFSDYWSHRQSLYQVPDCVGKSGRDFVDCSAPAWKREHDALMKKLDLDKLQPSDRRIQEVRRLLRALFPEAHCLRVVKVLSGGGTEGVPFVVAERDECGHESRPVQVKLHPDWRAIDAERRGFGEVVAKRLGPSIAHVVNGPLRVGKWSGMVQSFAAREDSGPESGAAPCSLEETLTKVLAWEGEARKLAGDLFRQLLIPLYGKGERKVFPVLRLLSKQGPAIFQAEFSTDKPAITFDFTPEVLSRKHERHRGGCAAGKWRTLFDAANEKKVEGKTETATKTLEVLGWRLETLEAVGGSANGRRARFTDEATGLKIDVVTTDRDQAEQAQALIDSPLPLRGLRPRLRLEPSRAWREAGGKTNSFEDSGNPWSSVRADLASVDVKPDPELNACGDLDPFDWLWVARPLDWHESFQLGPVHGDLNLGNALVTNHEGARIFSMIDFDQAESDFPIAFDLAKLEWESLTKIGWKRIAALYERLWEVTERPDSGQEKTSDPGRKKDSLAQFAAAVERVAVAELDGGIEGLLHRLGCPELCLEGDSLCRELDGYLEWRRAVAAEGAKLGVDRRQRLHALFAYGFATLKFKVLRDDGKTGQGAMPAQIALYSLQALISELDALDGVVPVKKPYNYRKPSNPKDRKIKDTNEQNPTNWIKRLRIEVKDSVQSNLKGHLIEKLTGRENLNCASEIAKQWKIVLQSFVAKHHPGGGRWMREILWHIRDRYCGKLSGDIEKNTGGEAEVAGFTLAMVWASEFANADDFDKFVTEFRKRFKRHGEGEPELTDFRDFASTGRLGNIFPIGRFFQHFANKEGPESNAIKISSRGRSGGTVDLLEAAEIAFAESYDAVEGQLRQHAKDGKKTWAFAAPGKYLCSMDETLMELRRETECMGCGDLVIASVTAKKLCVGISSFEVELVTGWDAKFDKLKRGTGGAVGVAKRWGDALDALNFVLGDGSALDGRFLRSNSNKAAWEWQPVGTDGVDLKSSLREGPLCFAVGSLWLAVGAAGKFLTNDDLKLGGSKKPPSQLELAFGATLVKKLDGYKKVGTELGKVKKTEKKELLSNYKGSHGTTNWWIWEDAPTFFREECGDSLKFAKDFEGTSALLFVSSKSSKLDTQFLDGFYSEQLSNPAHPWAGLAMWTDRHINYCLVIAPQRGTEELEALAWEFAFEAFRAKNPPLKP